MDPMTVNNDNNCKTYENPFTPVANPTTEKVNKVASKFDWPVAMCVALVVGGLAAVAVGISIINPIVAGVGAIAVAVGVIALCILGIVSLVRKASSSKSDDLINVDLVALRRRTEEADRAEQLRKMIINQATSNTLVENSATQTPAPVVETPSPLEETPAPIGEDKVSSPAESLETPAVDMSVSTLNHEIFRTLPETPNLNDSFRAVTGSPFSKQDLRARKAGLSPQTPRELTTAQKQILEIQSDRDALKLAILDIERFNSNPTPEGKLHLDDAIQRRLSARAELIGHTLLMSGSTDEQLIAGADKQIAKITARAQG